MMQRKKLLYIMGIDWDWIFQRPQIIEQHLEETYDVTVIFPRSILHFMKKPLRKYPQHYRILWTFPWQEKNRFIGWIASLFARKLFCDVNNYDVLMIGYPLYYRYIPRTYEGHIVYDCMDNHEALYSYKKGVSTLIEQEQLLIETCDALIATADKLVEKLTISAYPAYKQIFLIRNGTYIRNIIPPKPPIVRNKYKIGYFGTIAEWFDYEILLSSLEEYNNLEYHLIGPVHKECPKADEQIIIEGIVEHNKLSDFVTDYDCLIMPFHVNDIVEWVDPVKLYEYIAMGKCIISVKYPEIMRFNDYVYFYSNTTEYFNVIRILIRNGFTPKYNEQQQADFLRANSWEKRFIELDAILNEFDN